MAARALLAGALVAIGLVLLWPLPLVADSPSPLRSNTCKATSSRAARRDAVLSIPFDKLDRAARAKVASVLKAVSFFRRMPIGVVQCDPDLYLFLVQHPDVVVNIWQVMGITEMAMQETGPGSFQMTDVIGTKGSVEYLYSSHDTHLIYTEGSYDGPLFTRPVKGRGLLILKSGYVREPDGRYYVTSRMDAFMRVENVGVDLLTRAFSPLVGRVADMNFTYTAGFLGSLSRTSEKNHRGVGRLAGKLSRVRPEVREQLAQLAEQVAEKAAKLAAHDPTRPPQVASRAPEEESR